MAENNEKREFGFDRAETADNKEESVDLSKIFDPEEEEELDAFYVPEELPDDAKEPELDIDKDAKMIYKNNREREVEDKIKSIRENAINTFASEEKAESAADTDVKQATEENTEINAHYGANADVSLGETKNYDMSRLIAILKNDGTNNDISDDEDEDEWDKPKKKKKQKKDLSDDNFVDDTYGERDDDVKEIHENEYPHDFEYDDPLQNKDMFKSFRTSAIWASISVFATLVATALCIWFELGNAAGLPFSNLMHAGRYGKIFAMVCLQILAVAVFFNLDGLLRGVQKLSAKRPAPEACAFIVTAVCAVHTIITAAMASESVAEYRTFCFVGCFALFVLSFNTFVKAFTRFKAFTLLLSKKPKLATRKLDALSEENGIFAKYLNEDSEILDVTESESVFEFVKKEYTVPAAAKPMNIVLYIIAAVSVIVAALCAVVAKASLYNSITNGVFVFLFAAPASYLTATALPYFKAFAKMSSKRCAIIGEAASDAYENAGVISFADTEVFPPKGVKVTSIKTYGENRIDKVIVYMAKIFEKLGGPLSYVFASSVQDFSNSNDEVMVIENAADGIHLKVGEDDVLVGKGSYLRMFDIEAPVDDIDETEMRSLTSILYLVCNNNLSAKFYIRYTLNRKFEKILNGLYDAGVCCGIKSVDPGIDDQLVEGSLRNANYPASVIKKNAKTVGKVEKALSSGIISVSGVHNFLESFLLLDKLRGIYRTNVVVAIIGAVIGLAAAVFLVFAEVSVSVSAILLFQLLWLVPPILISLLSK